MWAAQKFDCPKEAPPRWPWNWEPPIRVEFFDYFQVEWSPWNNKEWHFQRRKRALRRERFLFNIDRRPAAARKSSLKFSKHNSNHHFQVSVRFSSIFLCARRLEGEKLEGSQCVGKLPPRGSAEIVFHEFQVVTTLWDIQIFSSITCPLLKLV